MSALLRNRLRACRSFLLTPGSRPERFAGARTGDDIIVEFKVIAAQTVVTMQSQEN
jgi:hypothetical protein